MKRTILILTGLVIALTAPAKTMTEIAMDSTVKDHKIIFFGKGNEAPSDSVSRMIRKFYEDQFRHFQDPLAPYFLFMSRDANLAMGMGGAVRMRGYYDWGGAVPSPGFAPYMIPMTTNPERQKYFGTTPAGTALFFRVIGTNKKLGEYQLYIEANFNGYQARDFRLKKAYGVINDWTIGYTNSTFSDPTALPPTVDASGPNAKMDATSVLVRWAHSFKHGFMIAASVETPDNAIQFRDSITAKVQPYIPDVAAFGQYSWDGTSHVRLSGILRVHPYRDLIQARNHKVLAWGLQLSSKVDAANFLTFYGMINGGRGFQSLGGDWLMGKFDLVDDPATPGLMYAPAAIGGYIAAQLNIRPNMFFSATFGGTRYMPKDHGFPDQYKSGLYMAVNYFWYLTPRISCAAEFNLGRRQNMDGNTRWARRAGILAQFSF